MPNFQRISTLLPAPELYVFYNGIQAAPLEQELKLSNAFFKKCDKITLEAVVKVINVNYGQAAEVLAHCKTLSEYSRFIHTVRENQKRMGDLKAAIEEAVKACVKEGSLRDFLKRNGGEVVSFLYDELSREECETIRENDGYQTGREQGRKEGLEQGRTEGAIIKTIEKVKTKYLKHQSIPQIADALEEPEADIAAILEVIKKYPDAEASELYKFLCR